MKLDELIAIDVHTHAEVSCRQPEDDYANEMEEQKKKYFKSGTPPTIQETCDYYRERKIGLVMFTVDTEFEIGRRRIANEEVLDAAKANSDIMIAFGSVDPHKGKMGLREVKKLIDDGVGGFKFHPTCQGFYPNDRMAYPYYELMNAAKLPVIFHSGHSGMGSGLKGGAVGVPAQAERLHRPVGLVAEVFPAAADPLCEHAAQAQDAVRHRLSADHAGTLGQGLRRGGLPSGSEAADPERERDPGSRPRLSAHRPSRRQDLHRALYRRLLKLRNRQPAARPETGG
jgi:hypothetical protein